MQENELFKDKNCRVSLTIVHCTLTLLNLYIFCLEYLAGSLCSLCGGEIGTFLL